MKNIFGTKPNQAPLNLNLGSMAYQDQKYVRVDNLVIGEGAQRSQNSDWNDQGDHFDALTVSGYGNQSIRIVSLDNLGAYVHYERIGSGNGDWRAGNFGANFNLDFADNGDSFSTKYTLGPTGILQIYHSAPTIRFNDTTNANTANTDNIIYQGEADIIYDAGNLKIDVDYDDLVADSKFTVDIDDVEKLELTSAGYLGIKSIGTSSPTRPLEITYASNTAYSTTSGNGGTMRIVNYTPGNSGVYAGIVFQVNGTHAGAAQASINMVENSAINASGHLAFSTRHNASWGERMRIQSDGNVGIGTSSPSSKLDIVGSTQNLLELTSSGSFGTAINITQNTPSTSILINSTSTGDIVDFRDSGTTVFTVKDGGKVLVGFDNIAYANGDLVVGKGITEGNSTLGIQSNGGTNLNKINFGDGSRGDRASIISGSSNYLAFSVFDGSSTTQEAMRIDGSGAVGISNTNPSASAVKLAVNHGGTSTDTTDPTVKITRAHPSAGGSGLMEVGLEVNVPYCYNNNSTTGIKVYSGTGLEKTSYAIDAEVEKSNNGTYRAARFKGGHGNVAGYGTQHVVDIIAVANGTGVQGKVRGLYIENPDYDHSGGTGDNNGIFLRDLTTASVTHNAIRFYRGSSNVGNIQTTNSSTSYNTTSDYRLKENVVELTAATTRLKQIPVYRFNFISDPNTTVDGFLAHEVQSIVPEAVTGQKDGMIMDENQNEVPDYQGIDQSKLVPLLVATIKELEARITALENT